MQSMQAWIIFCLINWKFLIVFRKKRRQWILEQIKDRKLHKGALIWVNSTKVLPFERDEKGQKSSGESHENMLDIIDVSSDESEGFDQDFILDEAVRSIATLNHQILSVNARSITNSRESKDSRGRVKSTNYSNENWIPISPHVYPQRFQINKMVLFS